MKMAQSLLPEIGERALIVGQTGSGKTNFACYLLSKLGFAPIIIYDTKDENKFSWLEKSVTVTNTDDAEQEIERGEFDFIIFRPPVEITSDPLACDDLLYWHYNNLENVGAYIDEGYTFHVNGQAKRGLTALLTRGRSRGITTIIGTQRPAWISRFCISEAQKLYLFKLVDDRDKKIISNVLPDFDKLSNPSKHGFWFYRTGDDTAKKFGAVPIVKQPEIQYDNAQPPLAVNPETPKRKWI